MNEDDAADQHRTVQRNAGVLFSFFDTLFSQAAGEVLYYLTVGLFRGIGTVLGWMLELLP
jgi:hypothetical protein